MIPIVTFSLVPPPARTRYEEYQEYLQMVRSGLTVFASNAQAGGHQAGLSEACVEAEVGQAVKDGSKPGVLNYFGNLSFTDGLAH